MALALRLRAIALVAGLIAMMHVHLAAAFVGPRCPGTPRGVQSAVATTPSSALPAAASPRRGPAPLRMSSMDDEMMILTPENAEMAIDMARQELGTLFGYTKENQAVGITGEVDFVDLDGVSIIVDLKGRFWHDRKMVLARVENYVKGKIPECFEVRVRDPRQLEAGNDDAESVEQFYRH